jgi:hypothetical protein
MSSIADIVEKVFSIPPKPPLSFLIELDSENATLFQVLMSIFIQGAKSLYGENICLDNITEIQFNTLNECMQSIGYTVKYNYIYHEESENTENAENKKIKGVNIWFEHYIRNINCHGIYR